jgi:protein-S-isoprenylcysteine O-methyltransferase Ste14
MRALECKVPPPVVTAIVAGGMWGLAQVSPSFEVSSGGNKVLALALGLTGLMISIAGGVAFRRAHTTVHPMHPEKATALVTSGIYRLSRNPMYLGIVLALIGWAAYLANVWTLAGPIIFILYIGRFQIAPEERALSALFGTRYAQYRSTVRRWL